MEATSLRDGVNQELGHIETRINIAKDGIRTKKLEVSSKCGNTCFTPPPSLLKVLRMREGGPGSI